MSNYKLTIVGGHGLGDDHLVGFFPTLSECSVALEGLERNWEKWAANNFPLLPEGNLLNHYEG